MDDPPLHHLRGNPVIPKMKRAGQAGRTGLPDPKVFWYAPTARWIMVTGANRVAHLLVDEPSRMDNGELRARLRDGVPGPLRAAVDATTPTHDGIEPGRRHLPHRPFDGHRFISEEAPWPSPAARTTRFAVVSDAPDDRRILIRLDGRFEFDPRSLPRIGPKRRASVRSLWRFPGGHPRDPDSDQGWSTCGAT